MPLSKTGAELLFEVFIQRYKRGSTLVTTNLTFDEWTERVRLRAAYRSSPRPPHPPRQHPRDEWRELQAQPEPQASNPDGELNRPPNPRLTPWAHRSLPRAPPRRPVEVTPRERDQAPTPCVATESKRHQLLRLKGLGPALSTTLAREVYYRQFANRRQVASYIGITPSAYDSGDRAVRKHTDCKWVLLYIERWLTAPVRLEDGTLEPREKGTPQGSVVSPLLANLFLHYASIGGWLSTILTFRSNALPTMPFVTAAASLKLEGCRRISSDGLLSVD